MLATLGSALVLGDLYMLSVWDELSDRSFDYFRGSPYQTWPVFGRAVGDLLLVSFLFWMLIAAVQRVQTPVWRKIGCLLLLTVFLVGVDGARVTGLHLYGGSLFGPLGKTGSLIIVAILATLTAYLILRHDRAVVRAMCGVLLFLLPLVPINICSTAWVIHKAAAAGKFAAKIPPPLFPTHAPVNRFVWVVFDEWDQYLSGKGRPSDLALPELDRFQAQALDAENAFSPAVDTQEALPSLITGKIVRKAKWTAAPNDLQLVFADGEETGSWSAQSNVFRRARQMGINTALIGFYHPYPRVIGGDISESFSLSLQTLYQEPLYWKDVHGFKRISLMIEESLSRIPLLKRHVKLLTHRREKRTSEVIYRELHNRALELVRRPDMGLVMLHLPVPHPPSIYDRGQKKVTAENDTGYIDSLALMDLMIGELRGAMEAGGQWDQSFVLLTSDHPLRGWEGAENIIKIRSPKQPRIPFLLKLPGQKTSVPYTPSFNSAVTHDLALAAFRGEFRNTEDVVKWLDAARLRFPTHPISKQPVAKAPVHPVKKPG